MDLNYDEIIKSYFDQNNILVKHQVDSYEEYIEKILPSIISDYFPIQLNFDSDKIKHLSLSVTNINIGEPFTTESGTIEGNNQKLEEGMVITIEPGLYDVGNVGVRIEDNVLITPKGPESLTILPRELLII